MDGGGVYCTNCQTSIFSAASSLTSSMQSFCKNIIPLLCVPLAMQHRRPLHKLKPASEPLDLDRTIQRLPLLLRPSNRLLSHDASTPMTLSLLVLVCISLLDCGNELRQFGLVFPTNLSKSEDSGSLLIEAISIHFISSVSMVLSENVKDESNWTSPSDVRQPLTSPCPSQWRTGSPSSYTAPAGRPPIRLAQHHSG